MAYMCLALLAVVCRMEWGNEVQLHLPSSPPAPTHANAQDIFPCLQFLCVSMFCFLDDAIFVPHVAYISVEMASGRHISVKYSFAPWSVQNRRILAVTLNLASIWLYFKPLLFYNILICRQLTVATQHSMPMMVLEDSTITGFH